MGVVLMNRIHVKRVIFILLLLAAAVVSCRRETVTKPEDNRVIVHADTVLYPDGSVVTGDIWYVDSPARTKPRWPYYLALAGLSLAAISVVWFFARRSRRVKDLQRALEEDRSEILRLEEDLSKMHLSGAEAAAALVRDRVEMVKSLIDKHDALKQREGLSYMDELESLQETVQNYRQFLDDLRGDTAFVGNLETALDVGKNGIMHKARTALGDLSEMDGLILTCIYAGMPPSSIGFVTGLKPGTVRTRKSRLLDRIEALPASGEKELLLREWV